MSTLSVTNATNACTIPNDDASSDEHRHELQPVLTGTLVTYRQYDSKRRGRRRQVIRGTWSYRCWGCLSRSPPDGGDRGCDHGGGEEDEGANGPLQQPFELIRNASGHGGGGGGRSNEDEDEAGLLRDGTYHGSFGVEGGGPVVREFGVRLAFVPAADAADADADAEHGRDGVGVGTTNAAVAALRGGYDRYDVRGGGRNRFGRFDLFGTAARLPPDAEDICKSSSCYAVVLRKSYAPPPPSPGMSGFPVTRMRTGSLRRRKRRFYDEEEEEEQLETEPKSGDGYSTDVDAEERRGGGDETFGGASVGAATGLVPSPVSAAVSPPSDGAPVTRDEFNDLLESLGQMQRTMADIYSMASSSSSGLSPPAYGEGRNEAAEDYYGDCRRSAPKANAEKSGPTVPFKKQRRTMAAAATEDDSVPTLVAEGPLTPREKRDVAGALAGITSDAELRGVVEILRDAEVIAATMLGDDSDDREIDLDIDRLDATTQRRLQRFLKVKTSTRCARKLTAKGLLGRKPGNKQQALLSPSFAPSARSWCQQAPSKQVRRAPASEDDESFAALRCESPHSFTFMQFSDSDDELKSAEKSTSGGICEGESTTPALWDPKQDTRSETTASFDIEAKHLNALSVPETDADIDVGLDMTSDWSVFKAIKSNPRVDEPGGRSLSPELWSKARNEAAVSRARDSAREARLEKVRAHAMLASEQQLAKSLALCARWRGNLETEKARQRSREEVDAETTRRAAREAVLAELASVKQTIDLNPFKFPYDELSGISSCASPLSDYGF